MRSNSTSWTLETFEYQRFVQLDGFQQLKQEATTKNVRRYRRIKDILNFVQSDRFCDLDPNA